MKKIKETMQKRYGVNSVSQISAVKQLKKNKSIEKYGVDCVLKAKIIKQKIKETIQQKYGVDNAANIPNIQIKKEQTCLERYGEKSFAKIKGVQEKRKNTCMAKYNVPNMLHIPNFQQITSEQRKLNSFKKYNVLHPRMLIMSEETRKILFDPILFHDILVTNGFDQTEKILGIAKSTIYKYHRKYNFNLITPYGSAAEMEISNWLNSINIKHIISDKEICKPKELDIYIPDHNLAIEFDGLYWHSENQGKDRNYHFNKTHKCAEQGVHLIHIFEDEWLNNKEICKSIISGALNQTANKIAARKCTIHEVPNKIMKDFLNENHLQGHSDASKNFILIYNKEIVAGMSFRKPRYNKQVEWELLRLATKCNTNVIGGTQKLWSAFLKTYNPNSIVSYCDRSYRVWQYCLACHVS